MKYQLESFRLAKPVGLIMRDDAALDGTRDDFFHVDAFAVVANLDHNLISLVIGIQTQHSLRRFARGNAVSRQFNAVIHCVAH